MSSAIDPNWPQAGNFTSADGRANSAAAKAEIEDLQTAIDSLFSGLGIVVSRGSGASGTIQLNSGTGIAITNPAGVSGGSAANPVIGLTANGVSAATVGTAASVPQITTDLTGRVTSTGQISIAITGSQVSGNIAGGAASVTGTVSGGQITGNISGAQVSGNIGGSAAGLTGTIAGSQIASGPVPSSVLPIATTAGRGLMQVGSGLGVDVNGLVSVTGGGGGGSYTLPPATTLVLGGVIVPSTGHLNVDATGNIAVGIAGASALGLVAVPSSGHLTISGSGSIGAPIATTSAVGLIGIGSGLAIDGSGFVSVTGGGGGSSISYTAPAGSYTISGSDVARLVDFTSGGSPTATVTTGLSLSTGWFSYLRASGSDLGLMLSGSDSLDGSTRQRTITQNTTALMEWDGTQFHFVNVASFPPISYNYWGSNADGSLSTSGNVSYTSSADGDMIVKNYSALTINSGHTITTTARCRGLLIYVDGDCTINGTLTMSLRGASVDPTATASGDGHAVNAGGVTVWRRTTAGSAGFVAHGTYGCGTAAVTAEANQASTPGNATLFTVARTGAAGAAAVTTGTPSNPGTAGSNGTTGQSGGGGSGAGGGGGGGNVGNSGAGGAGTCFSGGAGGGAGSFNSTSTAGTAGSSIGGAGGNSGASDVNNNATGGMGSSAGSNSLGNGSASTPTAGTGGLLILMVRGNLTIGGSGVISADGASAPAATGNAGTGTYSGASSGGGNILVLYAGSLSNSGSIHATGGTATTGSGSGTNRAGGAGGNGSVQGPTQVLV